MTASPTQAIRRIVAALRDCSRRDGKHFDHLKKHERGAKFERLAARLILLCFHGQDLSADAIERLIVGGAHDNQIDALALLINGALVESEEEIEAALDAAQESADVTFVFIQATLRRVFERPKISQFVNGVSSFCADEPDYQEGEGLQRKRALKEHLFRAAEQRGVATRVAIHGHFAALGEWKGEAPEEANKGGELKRGRRILAQTPWVSAVELEALDRRRLAELIDEMRQAPAAVQDGLEDYEASLPMAGLLRLPPPNGATMAYIGYVRAADYVALLSRKDGQGVLERAFVRNVRGFLGENGVNQRIRETLAGPERSHFALRNNGVTIVAEAIGEAGGRLMLRNFQVVNGLQTSHVLYQMRDQLLDAEEVLVPVKLIGGGDSAMQGAIIDASNRQNRVDDVGFYAASAKAFEIERYFLMRREQGGSALTLARRSAEQAEDRSGPTISFEELLRAFSATFLGRAHVAAAGFAQVKNDLREADLFGAEIPPEAYFAAAQLLVYARRIAEAREHQGALRVEHHAALALRVICAPETPRLGDATQLRAMAERIERQLADPERFETIAERVDRALEKLRNEMRNGRPAASRVRRPAERVERRAKALALPPP